MNMNRFAAALLLLLASPVLADDTPDLNGSIDHTDSPVVINSDEAKSSPQASKPRISKKRLKAFGKDLFLYMSGALGAYALLSLDPQSSVVKKVVSAGGISAAVTVPHILFRHFTYAAYPGERYQLLKFLAPFFAMVSVPISVTLAAIISAIASEKIPELGLLPGEFKMGLSGAIAGVAAHYLIRLVAAAIQETQEESKMIQDTHKV